MPKLQEIVELLNVGIQTAFTSNRFQSGSFDSIAELIVTPATTDEGESKRPAIVEDDGECTDMVITDTKPFQLYHLLDNLVYSDPEDETFGDLGTVLQEKASMQIVFLGDRGILKVFAEDIAATINLFLPRKLTHAQLQTLGLQSCIITLGEVNTDNEEVFSSQYPGAEYGFKPNTISGIISYDITTTYKKDCFTLCS